MSPPKVSVIIPSYNHAMYIGDAISSVLSQSFEDFELIIIDDGSSDSSFKIIQSFARSDKRIHASRQTNAGSHATINRGIAMSQGEYIAILNSDDRFHPTRIERLITECEKRELDFITTGIILIDAHGSEINNEKHWWLRMYREMQKKFRNEGSLNALFSGNYTVSTSNFFFRRQLYEKIGPLRHKKYVLDWDYAFKALLNDPQKYDCLINEPLLDYRLHGKNTITSGIILSAIEANRILIKYGSTIYPEAEHIIKQIHKNNRYQRQQIIQNHIAQKINQANDLLRTEMHNNFQIVINDLEAQNRDLRNHIHNLTTSHSYRLGQFITSPFRWIRKIIQHDNMLRTIVNNRKIRIIYCTLKNTSFKFIYPKWPWLHELIFIKIKAKIRRRYLNNLSFALTSAPDGDRSNLYALPPSEQTEPLVSIIVPNYCHASFLRMRLESIYGQTYKNFEVILLDDASSDDSRKIIEEFAMRHPEQTRTNFNKKNSGSVFRQWKKGLEMARGELVWIAESDDFCTSNFLESLVGYFNNQAINLAYCQSVFVAGDNNEQTWSIQEYLADIDKSQWTRPFIMSAHALVNKSWAIKNIIPNVSSALFRHPGSLTLLDDPDWQSMRICGDWVFYLHIIRGGLVAYDTRATNSYRIHPKNTSAGTYTQDVYYKEHEKVAAEVLRLYRIDPATLEIQRKFIEAHWLHHRPSDPIDDLRIHYDIKRIQDSEKLRKPNLMMASLGFSTGGGETFPILLANLLHASGYAVTFFNCHYSPTEPGIRKMLNPSIPVLELDRIDKLFFATQDMGIEIIHSHHAWVDSTICSLLGGMKLPSIVVTTHGMHEMIDEVDRVDAVKKLAENACHIVYVADKNLRAFKDSNIEKERFTRIENALPIHEVTPVHRSSLGIPEDAFVVCLVSRAIPEKGWSEALEIIEQARNLSGCDIHLVLAGDGPEFLRLGNTHLPPYVHLLGFRSDVRALFAMADVGFLPTRFKGESAPLVLIECLHAGKPMLASDLGEIRRMLSTEHGMAGSVIALDHENVNISAMAMEVVRLASEPGHYASLIEHVPEASRNHAPERMIERYERVYATCIDRLRHNKAHTSSCCA